MLQFSLRSLLLAVLLLAAICAWIATSYRQHEQLGADLRALAKLRSVYDLEPPGQYDIVNLFPTHKVENYPGRRGHLTRISNYGYINSPAAIDEFIQIAARHSSLKHVVIEGAELSDSQAAHLLSSPLTALDIWSCSIGGTLRAPASDTLQWLSFHRTRLDDQSLAALGAMPNVRTLDLTRTRVSDRSLDYLASLPNLENVILRRCKVTQQGAEELRRRRPNLHVSWEPFRQ